MFGMALCASPLVLILLGEKWVSAIPFLRIACFSSLLWPFHVINIRAILALGRSDYFLKMEMIKKLISVAILLFSFRHGVLFLACVGAFVFLSAALLIRNEAMIYLLGMVREAVSAMDRMCAFCKV